MVPPMTQSNMPTESEPLVLGDEPPIQVSQQAAQKIFALMQEEGNLDLKLRIYIQGGGCSGFEYGFSFEEASAEDDYHLLVNVPEGIVTILVDSLSLPYLQGAEVDYRHDINGEQFIVRNNPNAKTTCGCGSSFSV